MDIIRSKAVCFTGHRPEKLPDGGKITSPKIKVIKSLIYSEIISAANDGYDTFITGMQRGVDLWAGEAVMSVASERDVRLVAVLPHREFGRGFKSTDKWIFGRILDFADQTVIISEGYTPACMALRNRFMVENSSRIIAVIGCEKSGTGQTLRYAEKHRLDIRRINIENMFEAAQSDQLSLF